LFEDQNGSARREKKRKEKKSRSPLSSSLSLCLFKRVLLEPPPFPAPSFPDNKREYLKKAFLGLWFSVGVVFFPFPEETVWLPPLFFPPSPHKNFAIAPTTLRPRLSLSLSPPTFDQHTYIYILNRNKHNTCDVLNTTTD
jgi:hypothetical protein